MSDDGYSIGGLCLSEAMIVRAYLDGMRLEETYQQNKDRKEIREMEERVERLEDVLNGEVTDNE